jgi:hypothetical protein
MLGTNPETITGTGTTFDATGTATATGCALDPTGQAVDIGAADVWPSTCGLTPASDVKEFHGPVQSMNFVVPTGSTANSISYEAAYMILGFGGTNDSNPNPITPWTDSSTYEVRVNTSGTLQMIGATVGVDGVTHAWHGNANASGGAVVTQIAADVSNGKTQQTIGILSSGDADKAANLPNIKKLAFQYKGQSCGYTVDSDSTTQHDKRNVRDGHYYIWGPMHLLAHVDSNGVPTNPDVKTIIDIVSGKTPPPSSLDLIQVEAKASVVPDCAMRVYRDSEAGALSSYMPASSCSCKWETEANGQPAECKTCTVDTDCPAGTSTQDGPIPAGGGKCNYGFCEVK